MNKKGHLNSGLSVKYISIENLHESDIWPDDHRPTIRTLREWTRFGKIPHRKIGNFCYYVEDEIQDYIERFYRVGPD